MRLTCRDQAQRTEGRYVWLVSLCCCRHLERRFRFGVGNPQDAFRCLGVPLQVPEKGGALKRYSNGPGGRTYVCYDENPGLMPRIVLLEDNSESSVQVVDQLGGCLCMQATQARRKKIVKLGT